MSTLTIMEPSVLSFEQILKDAFKGLSDTQKQDVIASIINDEIPNSVLPGVALGVKMLLVTNRNQTLFNMLSEESKNT